MAFKLAYCTIRWKTPDLEVALAELKKAGWEGWACRLPLEWLGPPSRVRKICESTGMPLVIYTASGAPDIRDWEHVERNKRRIDFAAEMEVDCFMYMTGRKPKDRPVSDDDIKASAEGAESWAEYAAQYDLELSYHIHTNTLVDSIEHWKLYMSCLDKAKLCIDVSHAHLWGYDAKQSIRDFQSQLNYIHLQDYTSTSRDEDGWYNPEWCAVGVAENVDFPGIATTLGEIGYNRWVTGCPGPPAEGAGPLEQAQHSKQMYDYMKRVGY